MKPNKSGDGRVMLGMQPGGRFNATNVPLRMLIRQAFNVQEFQIVGGPDWLGLGSVRRRRQGARRASSLPS